MPIDRPPLRPWHPEAFGHVPVTTSLLAFLATVFALEMAWGGSEDTATLVRMGALVTGVPVRDHAARMLAYGALHIGLLHVAVNSISLWNLGLALEPLLGRALFLVLFLGSVLAGGLGIATFGRFGFTAGSSGGLFGLLGAVAVLLYARYRSVAHPYERIAIRNQLAMLVLPNVMISFVPGVSLAGHASGAAFGLGFMAVLRALRPLHPGSEKSRRVLRGASVLAFVLVLAWVVSIASIWIDTTPWTPADDAQLERLLRAP